MYPSSRQKTGFTIVEIMVVIGVLTLLFGVVFMSIADARAKSRDRKRIADLAQIELALSLYVEKNYAQDGGQIDCQGGMKIDGNNQVTVLAAPTSVSTCNDGAQILAFIQSQLGNIPADPKGPNNLDYYYYFDNYHNCNTTKPSNSALPLFIPMLFAVNMEKSTSNVLSVCPYYNGGNDGGLDDTLSHGGTISPSVPYVRPIKFSYQ
jgi:type II secretory pathway pseudopilin PulG